MAYELIVRPDANFWHAANYAPADDGNGLKLYGSQMTEISHYTPFIKIKGVTIDISYGGAADTTAFVTVRARTNLYHRFDNFTLTAGDRIRHIEFMNIPLVMGTGYITGCEWTGSVGGDNAYITAWGEWIPVTTEKEPQKVDVTRIRVWPWEK